MSDLLSGPRWKIERANQHIVEIKHRVAEFGASNAHKLVTDFDASIGLHKVRFETTERLQELVTLAFGDAAHNLRAALDYVWAKAIITLDSTADISKLHFPAGRDSRNSCVGFLDDGKQEHARAIATPVGRKLRDVILDTVQPYGTRDNPFCMLNELDNIDKHRLLLTLFTAGGIHIKSAGAGGALMTDVVIVAADPKAVLIGSYEGEFKGDMKPIVDVLIAEAAFSQHHSLIPTLEKLSQVVSQTVDAVERCINAHGSNP